MPIEPSSVSGTGLVQPSLVELAAKQIREWVVTGKLGPGERLVEERLTKELGISRPPLREALRLLQREGLVAMRPRHGTEVAKLDGRDAHEILTLRRALERLAIELGVPVQNPQRLADCRVALDRMQEYAEAQDRAQLVEANYTFHSSIVALAGHRRLCEMYASLQQQLMLCMARNLEVRERYYEDLVTHVQRHRDLLDLIERGNPQAVLAAFSKHGERSFTMFMEQ